MSAGIEECENKIRSHFERLPETATDTEMYVGGYHMPSIVVYVDSSLTLEDPGVSSIYNSILLAFAAFFDTPDNEPPLDELEFIMAHCAQPRLLAPRGSTLPLSHVELGSLTENGVWHHI